ncbi:MAG: ATP-binding cassette domain-containing protein [Lachnospiraceae bacterium]|nr:ATP-binding cassette domain-containing protein [Lachnospiraceae bacterium]
MDVLGIKYNKLNIKLIISIILLALVSTPVVLSVFWQPWDPNLMNYEEILSAPSASHIFGTDNYGRDIYARITDGALLTFGIAFLTVTIGAVVGTIIGAVTGYFGGRIDELLMRINDALASFPSVLLALVVVSVLDLGTLNVCIALGIVFIPSFARVMRAEFMAGKERDHVLNARLMGASVPRILFFHIFPGTLPVFIPTVMLGFNNAILAEAGLGFLGLGVQPPDPSLGRMLSESKTYLISAPWYAFFSCLFMVVSILAITMLAENIGVESINYRSVRKRISSIIVGNLKKIVPDPSKLLEVRDLRVGYIEKEGIDEVIKGISFSLDKGEILGIVGESGSGKSLSSYSIMGLIPDKACMTGGGVYLSGKPLNMSSSKANCRKRGGRIAMIFQEPQTCLNPVLTVGQQIMEIIDLHDPELGHKSLKDRIMDIISHRREIQEGQEIQEGKEAEIGQAKEISEAKESSSGLTNQKTGADAQAGRKRELRDLRKERVLRAMEDAGLDDCEALLSKYPHELSGGMRQRVMIAMALVSHAEVIIADEPTTALDAKVADEVLDSFTHINRKYDTSIILISHDLKVIEKVCHRVLIMQNGLITEELSVKDSEFSNPVSDYGKSLLNAAFSTARYDATAVADNVLCSLKDVDISYPLQAGNIIRRGKMREVVHKVSLDIYDGETLGIAGPSGCGKSTLVKAIAGLLRHVKGEITLNCERPAMVFQDPQASLCPTMSVRRILEEPLKLSGVKSKDERMARIRKILADTDLSEELLSRRVSGLSGGQKQRISVAAALLLNRKLIILDEPVSAIDVTLREQLLELLYKLKNKHGLTYILISHDEALLDRFCTRVVRMSEGRIIN